MYPAFKTLLACAFIIGALGQSRNFGRGSFGSFRSRFKNMKTKYPTKYPTVDPTNNPTFLPTQVPTKNPTVDPTENPTTHPTTNPTTDPTSNPTTDPTNDPTADPTKVPTLDPTMVPTIMPTMRKKHQKPKHVKNVKVVKEASNPTVQTTGDPGAEVVKKQKIIIKHPTGAILFDGNRTWMKRHIDSILIQ
eukprot:UN05117